MNKKVVEIPVKEQDVAETNKPLRVAAYCRVSTDKDEQQNSLEMQVKYYTDKIQGTPNWELVGIYTDEGISGTTDKKRPGAPVPKRKDRPYPNEIHLPVFQKYRRLLILGTQAENARRLSPV